VANKPLPLRNFMFCFVNFCRWIFKEFEIFGCQGTQSKCIIIPNLVKIGQTTAKIRADNRSIGHESNGSTNMDGHVGHGSVPVTH